MKMQGFSLTWSRCTQYSKVVLIVVYCTLDFFTHCLTAVSTNNTTQYYLFYTFLFPHTCIPTYLVILQLLASTTTGKIYLSALFPQPKLTSLQLCFLYLLHILYYQLNCLENLKILRVLITYQTIDFFRNKTSNQFIYLLK